MSIGVYAVECVSTSVGFKGIHVRARRNSNRPLAGPVMMASLNRVGTKRRRPSSSLADGRDSVQLVIERLLSVWQPFAVEK